MRVKVGQGRLSMNCDCPHSDTVRTVRLWLRCQRVRLDDTAMTDIIIEATILGGCERWVLQVIGVFHGTPKSTIGIGENCIQLIVREKREQSASVSQHLESMQGGKRDFSGCGEGFRGGLEWLM
jgi:hypothetical protein